MDVRLLRNKYVPADDLSRINTDDRVVFAKYGMGAWSHVSVRHGCHVFVGRSSDKTNERRLHVAGCLIISAIAMILSVFIAEYSIVGAFILLTISLCGAFGAYSPFWAIPPSFLTGAAAGGAIAFINSIGNLGGFFGPYFVGFINDLTGTHNMGMIILGISMIVSAVIVVTLVKQSGKNNTAESQAPIKIRVIL